MKEKANINSAILESIKNADLQLLLPILKEEKYTAKDIGLSSRNVSHWRGKGLLFKSSDEKIAKTTFKFPLSEAIWIRVMQYLRNFGLSISDLLEVKTQIFEGLSLPNIDNNKDLWMDKLKEELIKRGESGDKVETFMAKIHTQGLQGMFEELDVKYNPFEFLLIEALLNRVECGILVLGGITKDVTIWFDGIQEEYPEFNGILQKTHIYISFKQIFNELALEGVIKDDKLISYKELQILESLKSGSLKELIVSGKKGEPYHIKVTSVEDEYNAAKLTLKYPDAEIVLINKGSKVVGAKIVESRTI